MIATVVQVLFFLVLALIVFPSLFRWLHAFGLFDAPTHEPLAPWVHEYLREFDTERAIQRIGPSLLGLAAARCGMMWLRSAVLR